ncbi:hypothetical protein GCM10025789_10530 [Tessaracoccus lubricantis]|uniref:Tripartite tricarboxylate transporter TctB family protein n=2 Tax=Tessaracoccus lubricantis TaxID=545543 RepID=A0ABP9F712_9ACTN
MVVGGLVLAMIVAMFFIPSTETRAWVFTVMFGVLTLGLALLAVDDLRRRHDKVAFKPQTKLGWWAIWLSITGIAAMVLSAAYVAILRVGEVGATGLFLPMFVFTATGFLLMVAAGVLSLIAWFRSDERSWVVLLPLLPALFAVYFVIGEFTFPH